MDQVIFYTRNQCQLCKEAMQLLTILQSEFSFEIIEKNIDESDELTEKYGLMIPVIEMNNEIIQYGQIDYFTLQSFLKK
ncbi:glutaredoxin family protein [Heyndrickxia oleronia]|jgi:glutaredoxin|uniref:Thioredoxin family protein n=1 Tax=Heyndrickxia oleronia TaxID=38875 RepID=A0A8E2I8X2_9BACI|nr:glutaredoxin family protein [Heyndrickxia oleronia]NYV67908.1 glutaredoxin family protein [Bacillus sp. Gen3]OJH18273.1 NrdH-redoxin [Bacillus obstructivus]MBU5212088.1 glutaredoxin family protein [Heyndrickxia oleronia]MCI1590912.1 glutaredoxin family protein [Heyndrickxia oleronia]MCI1612935.1 glutaredoxin family protein [Heyndrickxia oleronia]